MMKKSIFCIASLLMVLPLLSPSQKYIEDSGKVNVVIVKDPYTDSRTGPELVGGPEKLEKGGLIEVLKKSGCTIVKISDVKMPPESEREYGEWNRASLTNRTLGRIISSYSKDEVFFIGLLSSSKSLVGMLAGLQHLGPDRAPLKDSRERDIIGLPQLGDSKPLKVGLVWIDAKAAFNTPDITLEGNMEGMNVAAAAGLSNYNLRLQAGLDPPLSSKHIVMAGVRDTTPYEDFNIDNSFIEKITVEDIRGLSQNIRNQMDRLSQLVDVIYIHVDMSVLDPAEIPDHPHIFPDGPSSQQLAATLEVMFSYSKTAAFGIASFPENPQDITSRAANRLIEGSIKGIKNR
ncbi:MAG: arginase family protein [Candidatus Aminicenantes bacterium]|nr:arginase family protein [Candidatus Aminicenantes bacterium]